MNALKHTLFYMALFFSTLSYGSACSSTDAQESITRELYDACRFRPKEGIEYFIKKGGDVKALTPEQQSMLHFAAINIPKDTRIIPFLVSKGLSVNARDCNGETPLHWACQNGSLEMVQALHDSGADTTALTNDRQSALHCASRNQEQGTKIIPFLIEKGVAVDAQADNKITPLHVACAHRSLELVETLLSNNADIRALASDLRSTLHFAAENTQSGAEIIPFLISKGLSTEIRDTNGKTPLHDACAYGSFETVESLCTHGAGADITALTNNRQSALHCAARNKRHGALIIPFLIDNGLKPNGLEGDSFNPVHVACDAGSFENLQALVDKGANVSILASNKTALHTAAAAKNIDKRIIPFLIKRGLSVDARTEFYAAPLHTACHFGSLQAVQDLLDNGADSNAVAESNYTALHFAVMNHNQDHRITQYLIDAGLHINAQDLGGQTPAHKVTLSPLPMAAAQLPLLIRNGADFQARDHFKKTPLQTALCRQNEGIGDCFLSHALFFIKPSTHQVEKAYSWLKGALYEMLIYKYGKSLKTTHASLENISPYVCKFILSSDPSTARYLAILLLHKLSKAEPVSLHMNWYLLSESHEVKQAAANFLFEKIEASIHELANDMTVAPARKILLKSPAWKAHANKVLLEAIENAFKKLVRVREAVPTVSQATNSNKNA